MKRVFGARGAAAAVVVAAGGAAAIVGVGVFGAHGAAPRTGPLSVHAGLKKPPEPSSEARRWWTRKAPAANSAPPSLGR